jgi:hypothetical protein
MNAFLPGKLIDGELYIRACDANEAIGEIQSKLDRYERTLTNPTEPQDVRDWLVAKAGTADNLLDEQAFAAAAMALDIGRKQREEISLRLNSFGPLKPPSDQALEVFAKVIENDPQADMRAIPNQWLLNERGVSQVFSDNIATLESRLDQCRKVMFDALRDFDEMGFESSPTKHALVAALETFAVERHDPKSCEHKNETPLPEIRREDGFVIQPWRCEDCGRIINATVESPRV